MSEPAVDKIVINKPEHIVPIAVEKSLPGNVMVSTQHVKSHAETSAKIQGSVEQKVVETNGEDPTFVHVLEHVDALIVGAGWAGIWLLHRLRQNQFNVRLMEANEDVGGVWLYTKYPGCRNETETPVYQFSAKETWESWQWKERFPTQDDMHAYMRHVTSVLDLRSNMRFNTRVDKAVWNEEHSRWVVYVAGRPAVTTTYFIPCTGYAGQKYIPNIPGLSNFKQAYHTACWPSDLEVKGKRVGVIGTGSSGVQTIETVGSSVGHLTVFQRVPNLANPRRQQYLTPEQSAEERAGYPDRYFNMNQTPTGLEVKPINRDTFDDDTKTRWAVYQGLWDKGAQNFWFGNYRDLLTSERANREAYAFWRSKTGPRIHDAYKRELLCPSKPPHAFGAKRPSLEETYFEVYNQDNVDLVDLKSDAIGEITSDGIKMISGAFHKLDIICLATGYDFAIGSQVAIPTHGRGGTTLKDKWLDPKGAGVTTYLGLMAHGFPNAIYPAGPQAPTAFGITPRLGELQGDWIADMLVAVRHRGCRVLEPTLEVERQWKQMCNDAVSKTLIANTDGWYMGNNIPGRKKETLFWFGGLPQYMEICKEVAEDGYRGFKIS